MVGERVKGTVVILSVPRAGPPALLQSPGPSPGPFINRRNVRLPRPGTFANANPGGAFCGEEAPLCAVAGPEPEPGGGGTIGPGD